jgi:ABC-2 type transport system permease protein
VNTILTTIKKELVSYFFSPVAYVIAVLYYFWRGLEVSQIIARAAHEFWDKDDLTSQYMFTNSSNWMILLVPPILTMRCFAEEKRSGSLEVLMSAPVRDFEIVLGKWLAALLFFAILWLPTLPLLWILTTGNYLAQDLAFGPVLSGYLGLFLLGSMLLAVGLFTSSFTDNQLLASLCAIIFNYALIQLPFLWQVGPDSSYFMRMLHEQINVIGHLGNWFGRGLIDSSQVMFYLGGTLFFLFLTVMTLGSRKWR